MSGDSGLPPTRLDDELRALLMQHPRESWPDHPRLGEVARFWLARHEMFRKLEGIVRHGLETRIDRLDDPPRDKLWLRRHLGFTLQQLDEHHAVEDHHYFPLFRRAEPRLGRGFALLDKDHDDLHRTLETLAERTQAVLTRADDDAPALKSALGRLNEAHEALARLLHGHLRDEEDLIIPLILERGEDNLLR